MSIKVAASAGLGMVSLWVTSVAAWITAIVHCVQTENIAMLIVDILIGPVGVIHGVMVWLGAV